MNSGHAHEGPESPLPFPDAAMLNQLPTPCWAGDATGRCTFVNRAWLAFTGRLELAQPATGWLEGLHPEDRKAAVSALESACRSRGSFELEYRLARADGSYRWVSDQGHPIWGPEGEVQGYLACSLDVHQRRNSEARFLRLGQLYQVVGRVNRAVAQHLGSSALFGETCCVAVEEGHFRLAWVGLVDQRTKTVTPVAAAGALPHLDNAGILACLGASTVSVGPESGLAEGIVGRACREEHFVLCDDLQEGDPSTPWSELARQHGLRASVAFPIMARGQARGVFALYAEEPGTFDSEMVDLLDRVAEDLGFALERSEQTKRRLEIEGRLRASERLFAAALDTMTAAIAVLDEHGQLLAVNAAWSDFQDEANHLIYGQGLGADYRKACSELVEHKGSLAAAAMGNLEVMDGTRQVFLTEYSCPGQTTTKWYATSVTRFSDEGFHRVVLAHREITKHKLAEERLKSSETLFRTIAESAVDLILVTDGTGRRLYCSPSFLATFGFTSEELEAQTALEIVHPEDRERVRRTFLLISGGGFDSTSTEYRLVRKDGESRRFEFHLTAIPDHLGGPMRILVVGRDITQRDADERERQRLEVQLRHSQKLESIGQLAAGIAHEINTPTQYIGDNLRFMQEGISDLFSAVDALLPALSEASGQNAVLLELLQDALKQADFEYLRAELPKAANQSLEGVARVSKIVGAMKEFSHPGVEDKTLADLNRAIESTITVSRNEWKYVADLTLDLDPALPQVPCLPSEINQAVLNLVVNAAHAIADQVGNSGQLGRITVRTRHEGEEAVIQVEDSGSGIPEAIRSRVFDPFFTTKEVGRGSGQGLAIAHTVVVDKHGGTIGFETAEGEGTLFTIRLPLKSRQPKKP